MARNSVFVLLWIFGSIFTSTFAQAQVSGNAIDLANMNMNMMHMKCPLEPCQSVCLKKQPQTGCFICDPTCNTGSNLGMPDSRLPMNLQPMNTGQSSFYNGCQHDSWMQCPVSCQRNFDQSGCFKCLCKVSSTLQAIQPSMPTVVSMVTNKQEVETSTTIKILRTESFSSVPTKTSTLATAAPLHVTTKQSPSPTIQNLTTKNSTAVTNTAHASTSPKLLQNDIHLLSQDSNRHTNGDYSNSITSTTGLAPTGKTLRKQDTNEYINEFKPNNLTFVLFGVMIVLVTFSLVFFIAWRKSSRKLKKNKDELYFVHKAYRQDSHARLSNNEMMDPVYADISPRPDPPPRSPHFDRSKATSEGLFTTNVRDGGPVRSFSQNSDTPLKEHFEECKHDYLELI